MLDLRAFQPTHLGSWSFVVGFPDEMASGSTAYSFQQGTTSSCYSLAYKRRSFYSSLQNFMFLLTVRDEN